MQDLQRHFGLATFSGQLPLFPLPGVVLFPCTLLPLHIFEPRYRAMVSDASSQEGCIGMVLLRPGWEADYYGNPPIHDIACLGKIVEKKRLEDGRYDIVLCGVKRARIEAVTKDQPYRDARVTLLEDEPIDPADPDVTALRERILTVASEVPPGMLRHRNLGRALRRLDAPLGCSADLLADSLVLSPVRKQEILEELDPVARATLVLASVDEAIREAEPVPALKRYPPRLSVN
jgi:Lon protease-like protein